MRHDPLTYNGRGWIEAAPSRCPNGHTLTGGKVLVGSHVCSCDATHHRTHRCRTCEAVVYSPPLTTACQDSSFDGRGRQ